MVTLSALLVGLPLLPLQCLAERQALRHVLPRRFSRLRGRPCRACRFCTDVVTRGWVSNDAFVAGYGAAQAVPGPLFTFAAYLGAAMTPRPNGWEGALLCLVAIFLPSFLLVIGALPFWEELRRRKRARAALAGINAAVVGLLIAAFYDPIWTVGITNGADFALAIAAFLVLFVWRTPPWLVVLLSALGGGVIAAL